MMVSSIVAGFIGVILLVGNNDAAPAHDYVVTCNSNNMRIDIPRVLVPKYNAEDLTFLDTSCSGIGNETHITLETGYRACGTWMSVDSTMLLFENRVRSKPLPSNAFIFRKRAVDLTFGCSLTKDEERPIELVSSALQLKSSLYELPVSDLKIQLKVTDSKGNSLGENKIVNIPVGEIVQIHISGSQFAAKGLRVSARNCHVTPVPDPKATPSYSLIRERCPTDETVKFIATNDLSEKFSFEVFRFLRYPTSPLHIHCETVICDAGDSTSSCAKGCEWP